MNAANVCNPGGGLPEPSPTDSFEIIKALFIKTPEPTKEDAAAIAPALFDVYQRLMRVRSFNPTIDYSERLWRLLKLVGLPDRSLRKRDPQTPSRQLGGPSPRSASRPDGDSPGRARAPWPG